MLLLTYLFSELFSLPQSPYLLRPSPTSSQLRKGLPRNVVHYIFSTTNKVRLFLLLLVCLLQIKDLLYLVGNAEADVAGERAVAQKNLVRVSTIWGLIDQVREDQNVQDGLLKKIDTTLKDVSAHRSNPNTSY
jgi:hypothetical protein